MKNCCQIKLKKYKAKTQVNLDLILKQMESIVDEKLKNIKIYTPVLFTVITSVVASLFLLDKETVEEAKIIYMWALGFSLVAFVMIIVTFFGKTKYSATIRKKKNKFEPHIFNSYCYLSDEDFCKCISNYTKKVLSSNEKIQIAFLKQKINECMFRRKWVNSSLGIVEVGTIIIIIVCFIFPFFKQ